MDGERRLARPAKRKRALLGSNPPRNSRSKTHGDAADAGGMRRSGPAARSRGLRLPSKPAATASGWRYRESIAERKSTGSTPSWSGSTADRAANEERRRMKVLFLFAV